MTTIENLVEEEIEATGTLTDEEDSSLSAGGEK